MRLLSSSVDFPGDKTKFLGQVDEVPLLRYFTAVSDIFIYTSPKELENILTFNIVNRLKISATGKDI